MIFLSTILALVVFLAISKRDVIRSGLGSRPPATSRGTGSPAVLVVLNKVEATAALLEAVQRARGRRRGALLRPRAQPRPRRLRSQRRRYRRRRGAAGQGADPAAGSRPESSVSGRVADSPNAYDDIVAALDGGNYREIILETPPTHLSHWLHVDLPERVADLGYPLTTVTATS